MLQHKMSVTEKRLRRKIQDLKDKRATLSNNPDLSKYMVFLGTSDTIKNKALRLWDEYYAKVRDSEAYQDHKEMMGHWKTWSDTRSGEAKEAIRFYVAKAHQRQEENNYLPTPNCTDPREFTMNGFYGQLHARYEDFNRQINEMENELTDYEGEDYQPMGVFA